MKKVLQFSGLIALGLALVGFILMMVTPAVVTKDADTIATGTQAIFGGNYIKLAPLALLAWIFALLAILVIVAGVVLSFLKINKLAKFAGLIDCICCLFFIMVGIFMFLVVKSWGNANVGVGYIGAGWVIGGILFLGAGILLVLPDVLNLVGKK